MANVYHSKTLDEKFLKQLKSELSIDFNGCKRIAIKLHFGEPGNSKAFTPKDIEPIITVLKELKFDYFLYDSNVTYGGQRSEPKTHKAYALTKGFKNVVTGDEYIDVKGEHLTYQICKKLTDADGVLVLTHVKGHVCTGFGGAIKNLGMGALTAKTKEDIHNGGKPVFSGKCVHCAICCINCPIDGMKNNLKQPYPIVNMCFGCSNCAYVCPHNIITTAVAPFDILLSEGAYAAQSKFKKFYYVSMVNNIARQCDCMSDPGDIIAKDAGWIMSPDGVAIDQAAYDIIVQVDGETFLKHNKKKGHHQLEAAEKLGMGKRKYVLKEL